MKFRLYFLEKECVIYHFDLLGNILLSKRFALLSREMSEEEIVRVLAAEIEMQQNDNDINLICQTENFAFVPATVFEEKEAENFLVLQKVSKNNTVIFNELADKNMVNVFAAPRALLAAAKRFFPACLMQHHLTYIIENAANNLRGEHIFVWLRNEQTFDLLALIDNRLQLANSFSFRTAEDFVYFVLNVFEQLSLNTETCEIQIFNAKNRRELTEILKEYVVKVEEK